MELNSVGSMDAYSEISETAFSQNVQGDSKPPSFPENREDMDISRPGMMMNAISQMSEEERAEMKAFHEKVIEAVENGTFDTSELAAEAPESMVQFTEENGLDLEQMIEGMAQSPQGHKGPPPPPPPMMYGANGEGIHFKDNNEGESLTDLLLSDENNILEQSSDTEGV